MDLLEEILAPYALDLALSLIALEDSLEPGATPNTASQK
jgi:hypothetical protein